jgi:hypothetical protein
MTYKRKTPEDQLKTRGKNQFPSYDELSELMISETTSILNDFQRQWIGAIGTEGKPGDAIFINFDPVLQKETYLQWAQYDLYWYLEKDTQVGTILDSAKVNVSGMAWDVKPFLRKGEKKPSASSQAQADFIKDMFEGMETFPQHLFDLMDALGKGFSFSEIVWERKDIWWNIVRLMNRPQRRIQFDAQTRQPRIRTIAQPFYGEKIEPGKYIVHRCSSNWENPFGDALDQSLYWPWMFKRMVIKFWTQHEEVGASSIPIVQVPSGANSQLKSEALDIAKMIRNGAFGYIPANFTLMYAEAKNALQNAETYEKYLRYQDEQMTKRVKGQVLTTEGSSSGGHGSRGMGQTHKITEDQFDIFRAKGLASSVNKYLVKYASDYNFANIEGYPRFCFDVEEEEDMKNASEVFGNLVKALPGYDPDIEQINEKFGYTFTKKEKKDIPQQPLSNQQVDENGNLVPQQSEFAQGSGSTFVINVPKQPVPNVTVNVPQQKPRTIINLPEQKAPVVNVMPQVDLSGLKKEIGEMVVELSAGLEQIAEMSQSGIEQWKIDFDELKEQYELKMSEMNHKQKKEFSQALDKATVGIQNKVDEVITNQNISSVLKSAKEENNLFAQLGRKLDAIYSAVTKSKVTTIEHDAEGRIKRLVQE